MNTRHRIKVSCVRSRDGKNPKLEAKSKALGKGEVLRGVLYKPIIRSVNNNADSFRILLLMGFQFLDSYISLIILLKNGGLTARSHRPHFIRKNALTAISSCLLIL
jgi:hypothetical protein